jgi:hypothetical protein
LLNRLGHCSHWKRYSCILCASTTWVFICCVGTSWGKERYYITTGYRTVPTLMDPTFGSMTYPALDTGLDPDPPHNENDTYNWLQGHFLAGVCIKARFSYRKQWHRQWQKKTRTNPLILCCLHLQIKVWEIPSKYFDKQWVGQLITDPLDPDPLDPDPQRCNTVLYPCFPSLTLTLPQYSQGARSWPSGWHLDMWAAIFSSPRMFLLHRAHTRKSPVKVGFLHISYTEINTNIINMILLYRNLGTG